MRHFHQGCDGKGGAGNSLEMSTTELLDLKCVKRRGIQYDSLVFGLSNWVGGPAVDWKLGRPGCAGLARWDQKVWGMSGLRFLLDTQVEMAGRLVDM